MSSKGASSPRTKHVKLFGVSLCSSDHPKFVISIMAFLFTWFIIRPSLMSSSYPEPTKLYPQNSTKDTDPFASLHNYCAHVPPIATSEFHARQSALAKALLDLNASAYIAEPGANALFFGNISDSNWHLSERPLLLIVTPFTTSDGQVKPNVTILTPKFETGRAKLLSIPASEVTFVEWAEDEDPYKAAVSALPSQGTIYIAEATRLFIRDGIQEAVSDRAVLSAPLAIRSLRERKSPAEIALLRCVNEATLEAMRAVKSKMHLGIRQSETSRLLSQALGVAGLSNGGGLVLFGPNAALPHGGPVDRELEAEDFILFDGGGKLHGYTSDITRSSVYV
ncbi:hypothetical protein M422DRAFT_207832 [Sphaerobolus stellatus SS14]|uniref:Peptidase M24 domain-containing protein n=1 Tax=Sphaerobolus stellatus (strain SS14) TaxID=990650 RepID=A0A0C9W010_SPHS4|nr:hypothetical protein M422DRAFT_207832 [Sphaerobolus stellatus SS14]